MTDNVNAKDGAGISFTMAMKDRGDGVKIAQSVATDSTGNVLVGQKSSAASLPIVPSSDYFGPPNLQSSGTISAVNGTVTVALGSGQSFGIEISGTWVATLIFEYSRDGGTTWHAAKGYPGGGGIVAASTTANGDWAFRVGAVSHLRVKASAFTSGSVTVNYVATQGLGEVGFQQDASAVAGGIPSTARLLSAAASTNATSVKASQGRLYAIQGANTNAARRFLKLYNKASAPTVGADTPVKTLSLPAAAEFNFSWPVGLTFTTGIAFALTTGGPDADTGALTAADVIALNLDYA